MARIVMALALVSLMGAASAATTAAANAGTDLRVARHGDQGRPVVLVPGLGGGAWVWEGLAAHLQASHSVYVVTLPGFDGTAAPASGDLLAGAEDALVAMIRERHLQAPVLIGHSLGGTLALKVASEHPGLLAGVVAVDGLPVFPGTENLPPAQRVAMASTMQAKMQELSPAEFEAQQLGFMKTIGVRDPAKAVVYGKRNAASDPKAVARYMAEDLALDLRPRLKQATVPLLEISPYNPPDFASGPMVMSEQQKTDYYRSLLSTAPHAEVVSIAPSRHFVMFDQPEKLQQAVDAFLAGLPAPAREQ